MPTIISSPKLSLLNLLDAARWCRHNVKPRLNHSADGADISSSAFRAI